MAVLRLREAAETYDAAAELADCLNALLVDAQERQWQRGDWRDHRESQLASRRERFEYAARAALGRRSGLIWI